MRVLVAASEIHPLAKTGGLADVCAALPAALRGLGVDAHLVLPGYESALDRVGSPRLAADLGEILGVAPVRLVRGVMPASGLPVWLVDCPNLFRRPGTPYQDAQGVDWPDNALRFALFCRAAARIALGEAGLDWQPDLVHTHDWHTGLLPYLLSRRAARPRSVFTIHNAAFQGNFPVSMARRLGLPREVLTPEGIEFWGQLSFLKAGVRYADRLTTVSPTYARELRTPQFGCGLEGLIEARAADFVGILNGIDTEAWNPATDRAIAERYSRERPDGKATCKCELQLASGLARDPQAPLVAFASRLTWQKMADLTLAQLPQFLERHPRMQFSLVGCGERALEEGFAALAARYPGRVAAHIGYAEPLERCLHAGADVLLHGSRYEPCGLAQLYAMRYGAVPVVRRVGGLADTVADGDTGFVFGEAAPRALEQGLERCLEAYGHDAEWRALQRRAMAADFSWERSAASYLEVYEANAPLDLPRV